MPSYKRQQSKRQRALKKSSAKKRTYKMKSRKIKRGGAQVTFNSYMTKGNFKDSSISSQAKEIAQKIFNEKATLDDVNMNQFAQVERTKGQLSENDLRYFTPSS